MTKPQIRTKLEITFADLTTDDIITHLLSHFTCDELDDFHNEITGIKTINTEPNDD